MFGIPDNCVDQQKVDCVVSSGYLYQKLSRCGNHDKRTFKRRKQLALNGKKENKNVIAFDIQQIKLECVHVLVYGIVIYF